MDIHQHRSVSATFSFGQRFSSFFLSLCALCALCEKGSFFFTRTLHARRSPCTGHIPRGVRSARIPAIPSPRIPRAASISELKQHLAGAKRNGSGAKCAGSMRSAHWARTVRHNLWPSPLLPKRGRPTGSPLHRPAAPARARFHPRPSHDATRRTRAGRPCHEWRGPQQHSTPRTRSAQRGCCPSEDRL